MIELLCLFMKTKYRKIVESMVNVFVISKGALSWNTIIRFALRLNLKFIYSHQLRWCFSIAKAIQQKASNRMKRLDALIYMRIKPA